MKRHLLAAMFLVAFLAPAPRSGHAAATQAVRAGKLAGPPSFACRPADACAFLGRDLRAPCKVELVLLGQFMKDHGGIDVVTISADLVPDLPAATRAWLEKAGLWPAENWVFSDGFVERLRFEIDPSWQGDIPRA